MKKILLLLIFSFFAFKSLYAQSTTTTTKTSYGLPPGKDFDRWSAGITIGVSHLLSDLLAADQGSNRVTNQGEFQPALGLQVHHQITHSIGMRVRGMFTTFTGHDLDYLDAHNQPVFVTAKADTILTAEKFKTPMKSGAIEMTYNFGNISFLNRNKNFHFVATLGIGFFNYKAEVKSDSARSILLRSAVPETQVMVPMSLGFKYKIRKVDIGMALEYNKTYVDNVDATVKTLSEYDDYVMLTAAINYTFGKKNKPMEWINPLELVYNDLADMKEKIDIMSGDKDKDGVSDLFDKDNSTPEGTKVYGDGTAVDTDGDGIPDSKDADLFTPKGAKVDDNGMEIDTDKDGVADSRDLEPDTKPGTLVNFQGVTIPVVPANGGNGINGLNGTSIGFLPPVFFDIGSSMVKPAYYDRLLIIAKLLKNNPTLNIKVVGNTDITGDEPSNNKLGNRRAENVKKHLQEQYNIDGTRITTETRGETDPLAKKLNTMNRRVDFEIAQ